MSVLLGIDLGTTNSLGCIYRNGRIELIPNRFKSFLTPSVVSLDEQEHIVVGQIAKERLITCPEKTVGSFKTFMGEERKINLGNKSFTPEELSSFVVRSIVDDAEAYLGEKIEEVVISVPAYFHDKQRYATKKAGILAGVTVNRLINEPSAAALAAYLADGEEQMFLVFDFGGGTLDVSIVDCFETVVEIVAVAGDNHLGGDNFHDVMADSFLKEHGFSKADVSLEELALIRKQAEACKIELSTAETAKMNAWINGKAYVSEYTNQRLLEESASVFMRIKQVLTNAITSACIQKNDLAGIVMAGGSSKMPIVSSYVEYLFRQQPVVDIHSDELIVRGLGYLCGVKARDESVKDYVLTDICPFSLGTAVHNESDLNNAYFSPIIQKNTVLPCSRVRRFYTAENGQKQIRIEVLQGEHAYAKDNRKLAEYTIAVPKKKAGQESVDVRFTYDIDGILMADITVVSSGQTISKVVSQTVDDGEMEARMKQLEKLKVHPKDINENKLLLSRLEALFEEVGPQQREYVANLLRAFDSVLEEQNPRKIKRYRESFSNIIDQFEHYDPFAEYNFMDDFYDEDMDTEEEAEEDSAEEDLEFAEYTKKMDKLIAAEILKVSEDASVREIKKAYARMLREYHPEEYPEEFKRIQEAYEVLTDRENGNSGGGYSGELHQETRQNTAGRMERWETSERGADMESEEAPEFSETFDYSGVAGNEEDAESYEENQENAERDMEFERTEWKAQQEQQLRKQADIELAGKELEMIVNSRSLKHRLDSYENFLRDERYRYILCEDEFILKACDILNEADLKKEVYDLFAGAYHFREYKPEQLKASAQKLYKVVDAHCKLNKKQYGNYILFAAILPIFRGVRSMAHTAGDEFVIIAVMIAAFAALYLGYHKLIKYYTHYRIHILYSLLLMISQIIMLLGDVYRNVLGLGDDGDVIAVILFLLGGIYFIAVAAAYVGHKIKRKFKRYR